MNIRTHKSTYTKYTQQEWDNIIQEYTDGDISQKEMATKYNVSYSTIQKRTSGIKAKNTPLPKGTQRGMFITNGNYTIVQKKNRTDRLYEWECTSCGSLIRRISSKLPKTCTCHKLYKKKRIEEDKERRRDIRKKKKEIQNEIDRLIQDNRELKKEQKRILIGTKWNRLTILEHLEGGKCLCRCECGNETTPKLNDVTNEKTKSCGCINTFRKTHGMSNTPVYRTWRAMRRRCNDPKFLRYEHYGGRGITVCEEWDNSFESFYEYMGERPEGMTIDRIDVDGNYEPGNVRWANPTTQTRNQRRFKGKKWDD